MSNTAGERLSFEQALAARDETEEHLSKIITRLRRISEIPRNARFLDIGSAQGLVLLAANKLGLRAVGLEPWEPAREVAQKLAKHLEMEIDTRPGQAESLDFADESFDIVHSRAVAEHVKDPQIMFEEAFRVLKPGGVFWFCTTNRLCPRQNEIAWFPCFSWYPFFLQHRLTRWTQQHRPEWIGHTDTPAMHWFSPARTGQMLNKAGFQKVYDCWDLRLDSEGGRFHAMALRLIKRWSVLRLLAYMCVQGASWAAVKAK
jgi:SAM-dependent methyltransferase